MTAIEIHIALRTLYPKNEYAYLSEFRAGTGHSLDSNRYLDAWVMACFPSSGMVRIGIEIKVIRSDFMREMKKPIKRDAALRLCNEFYFATPKGLLTEADLPVEAGLIEIDPLTCLANITVEAPFRETQSAIWPFVASLARRADDRNGQHKL